MGAMDTINQWAGVWVELIFIRILDSTLVFLLVGLLWLIVRRKASAQFGYLMFLLVLLKLIMPVQFSVPGWITYWFPESAVQEKITGIGFDFFGLDGRGAGSETTEIVKSPDTKGIAPIATSSLTTPALFLSIWLMGVLAFLLYQAWVEWKTRFMMRNTIALDPQSFPVNLQKLQEIAGIKRQVKWVTGYWVKSPVAYGYFRPMIAVPSDIAQHYTVQQLRWILLHELAHIKRGDAFVFLFQRFLLSLFFFHPVVWCANALIDQLREYACDDAALKGSQSSPRECGEGFLGAVMQSNGLPTFLLATHGLINYKTMIRRRLMRILDEKHATNFNLSRRESLLLLASTPAILLMGGKTAAAQEGEWIKADAVDSPPARILHLMVYDSAREVIVLHGGMREGDLLLLNDTWEWNVNTQTWKEVSNEGPSSCFQGMAYDPVRKVTVLSGNMYRDCETWEWDGVNWEQKNQENFLLMGPAMAYYPDRKTIIRHGGAIAWEDTVLPNTIQSTPQTWEWDGNRWSPLPDGPSLGDHKMVYDSVRNKLVVFGGFEKTNVYPQETWEFDGVTWTKEAETGPAGRQAFDMVFDSDRGVTVLASGGLSIYSGHEDSVYYHDTWQWDGTKWSPVNVEFPPNGDHWFRMVYNPKHDQIVLFGGATSPDSFRPNDTWLFSFTTPSGIPFSLWSQY